MRSLRFTSCLLIFAAALAFAGCRHSAGNAAQATGNQAQSNQAANQAQAANTQAQPADSQAPPSNAPAEATASSDQSAAGGAPAASEAPSQTQPAEPAPADRILDNQSAQLAEPAPAAQPAAQTGQPAQDAQTQQPSDSSSAQNQPQQVTIPDGTPVEIRLAQSIGSVRSASGQIFSATLDAPIVVDNAVVVPQGANVTGRVLYAKHSGRLKGRAQLAVTLTSLEVNGQNYRIVTSHKSWRGGSHKKRNLAWIGGGGGGGALVGAVAGGGVGAAIGAGVGAGGGTVTAFVTGRKNIVLPTETRLRFVLRRPVTVSES